MPGPSESPPAPSEAQGNPAPCHDDGFSCCGGNDEEPREHTLDCQMSVARSLRIEDAAYDVARRPSSSKHISALEGALASKPGPMPSVPVHVDDGVVDRFSRLEMAATAYVKRPSRPALARLCRVLSERE